MPLQKLSHASPAGGPIRLQMGWSHAPAKKRARWSHEAANRQKKALGTMKERVRLITKRSGGRSIERVASELRSYLLGWKAYFQLADTPGVFGDLDKWIRHRLRAIHLKHWKRGRTTFRQLRARGLSATGAAKVAGNGRRWWRNSGMLIHVAFPLRYFDQLGIPRLAS
jgi:RNA-directed DNA polymerase